MIHHEVLEEIKKRRQHGSFIYPDYGNYSIAEIPSTILSFFNVPSTRKTLPINLLSNAEQKYKKLLFFFVDGFAYDHFVEFEKDLPFFNILKEKTDIYPLTSVFPSTTSAALTCLHTGLTPQEHGLPEWTVYFEELDRISFGTLKEKEGKPQMLYEGVTIYSKLKEHGVTSYVFTLESYFPSSYSAVTQEGAVTVPYTDANDLFPKILETLEKEKDPCYMFVYWGKVDTVEHLYGPKSKEHIDALREIGAALKEKFLAALTPNAAAETAFILSSDHGQANIRNEEIIYLNTYIDLESSYFITPSKKIIFPTGAPHDVFLHIDDTKVEAMLLYLKKELEGKAEVITTKEACARGIFGLNTPTARFTKRIGDILILPFEGYHVWYQHTPDFFWKQLGIHGGLSRSEMLVPIAVSDLAKMTEGK